MTWTGADFFRKSEQVKQHRQYKLWHIDRVFKKIEN